MELLLFTALGFIVGLVLRAGREEEAYLRGAAIGRRQARAQMHPPFPPPPGPEQPPVRSMRPRGLATEVDYPA